MYITWWSSESGAVTFKCQSVMVATDPGREWELVLGSQWQQTAHSCFELRAEL